MAILRFRPALPIWPHSVRPPTRRPPEPQQETEGQMPKEVQISPGTGFPRGLHERKPSGLLLQNKQANA